MTPEPHHSLVLSRKLWSRIHPHCRAALFALIWFACVGRIQAQPQPSLFTVLHTFLENADGAFPVRGPVLGPNGVLYGCTARGGLEDRGVIYRINLDGSDFSVIHQFTSAERSGPVGSSTVPGAYVMLGTDNVLYGTSMAGTNFPDGMAFRLNTDGTQFAILHSFTNVVGALNVMQGRDGDLYGAGFAGIFKLAKDGSKFSLLHTFDFQAEGNRAYGRLLHGSDGALYGTCYSGTENGSVFRINTDGSNFAVLHSFSSTDHGARPYAGVIEAPDGWLYGTTSEGGSNGVGTVCHFAG